MNKSAKLRKCDKSQPSCKCGGESLFLFVASKLAYIFYLLYSVSRAETRALFWQESHIHIDNCSLYISPLSSFGGTIDEYPHPEADFSGFKQYITALNNASPYVLGPVSTSGKDRPWVKVYRLKLDPKPPNPSKSKCTIC